MFLHFEYLLGVCITYEYSLLEKLTCMTTTLPLVALFLLNHTGKSDSTSSAAWGSVLIELHWNLGFDAILQDAALILTLMFFMSFHNYSLYSSYTYILVCTLH